MQQSQMFRKKALEKLSSPEHLDEMMVVTSPFGWISLLFTVILVITAIIWGIFGGISTKVQGTGMLIKGGGIHKIVSIGAGRLTDISVKVGDIVKTGKVVARVAQPDVIDSLRKAEAKLEQLREQSKLIEEFGSEDLKLQTESILEQRSNLKHLIEIKEGEAQWLKEKVKIQGELLVQGLVTKQTIVDTQQRRDSVVLEIAQSGDKLNSLLVKEFQVKSQREQDQLDIRHNIAEQKTIINSLKDKLSLDTKIVSPYTGRILEVMVEIGDIAKPDSPLFSLELEGKDARQLEAIIYVSAVDGKKVKSGMTVQISPTTAKKEEYGTIKGLVTSVSDFPATNNGMMRILQNKNLVSMLSGSGAPIAVNSDLLLDSNTMSGLKWTSSKGPPIAIQSGTMCDATIAVKKQRPISLVIPLMKKYLMGGAQ